MEIVRALQGTRDILPDQIPAWRHVEGTARAFFERWGYREIRTPIFEDTRLFQRGIGEATDIVEKEMYTLETQGGTRLTLRPEATAPVVRAYLEHAFPKTRPFQKFYYIGPNFRHERPQAHRYRQHSQLGLEALGSKEPRLDAETISVAHEFFRAVGLPDLTFRINSLGDETCRPNMRDHVQKQLEPKKKDLCEDCQRRYERNVFRIIDCKQASCQRIVAGLPDLTTLLCDPCRDHFSSVQETLHRLEVPFDVDPRIVRGLDYYSRTIWEIEDPSLGAHSALGGGGRYDPLLPILGGPDLGGVGFALGADRIVEAVSRRAASPAGDSPPDIYVIAVDDDARGPAFYLAERLRREGIRAETDHEGRSVKAQMRQANKLGARYTTVLGPQEIGSGTFRLKNMETGEDLECRDTEIADKM